MKERFKYAIGSVKDLFPVIWWFVAVSPIVTFMWTAILQIVCNFIHYED